MSKEEFISHMEEVLKRIPSTNRSVDFLAEGLQRYKENLMSKEDEILLIKKSELRNYILEVNEKIAHIDGVIVTKYGTQAIVDEDVNAVVEHLNAVYEVKNK